MLIGQVALEGIEQLLFARFQSLARLSYLIY
jgi:hypothetical protein